MYRIKLTARAKKELNTIKIKHQEAIGVAIEELKEDPYAGKPLTRELRGKFSYRVGVFRLIYTVNEKDKIIQVITAGHRAVVYG
jgi:mRNA interferase RelE/StbE